MGHSATLVDVTRRWGVRAAILLIAGIVFVVVLIVLTAQPASAATCDINGTAVTTLASQPECDALVALYASTDGPNWDTKTGWNTPTDPCGWHGVVCGATGITSIELYSNNLTGSIPAEFGGLVNLDWLQVGENQLMSVPAEIGDLTSLTWIDLSWNELPSLPAEIGNLTALENLDLSGNQLSTIPDEIGNLSALRVLALGMNQITSVPLAIGNLTNLVYVTLESNQVATIPRAIGNLTNLDYLGLEDNQLKSLPVEIGSLTGLSALILGQNNLSTIPPTIGSLTGLTYLRLEDNTLASIPPELGDLTNLKTLWLNNNRLSALPAEMASLSALSYLYLDHNALSGDITTVMAGVMGEGWIHELSLSDGLGGNNCLSVTDAELASSLTLLDAGWDECDGVDVVVVGGSSVVSDAVITGLEGLVSGSVTRVWGANRYATAAAISEANFAPGVSSVFIATGENFPDALAAGPAAGIEDSPILLVRQNAVPSETAAELTRLSPSRIVVAGGPAVVSDGVMTTLDGFTSGTVTRMWGANRYATAAAVSAATFSPGVSTVYVATGANFPDALAGGPAGVINDGPILLVRQNAVPSETAAELARLHPATIVVLGGPAVVSSGVVTQLEGMASSGVSRLWGANRYATAVAVSEAVFATGANAVFIVTGVNFPDAVAAGPVAGMLDAPILLVTGTSVPTPTQAEVTRLAQ